MKTLEVVFLNNSYGNSRSSYHYLVEDDVKVIAGDHAVVHNGSELRLVKVIGISGNISSKATKTVVCIINTDDINKYNEANKKLSQRKALYARLDQLLAQEAKNNKYKFLVQSNKEAARILSELGIN